MEIFKSSYYAELCAGIIMPALSGIADINGAITCSVGVVMAIFGMFDVGSLVAFILLMQRAGLQIGVVAGMLNMILAAVAGTERVKSILEQEDETVFIIAHRLSTVRRCDSILVSEHGKIIERGSHTELLEKRGRYHALYTGKEQLE